MTDLRRSFEQRVGPLVVIAGGWPKAVPFLVIAGLLVAGLVVEGIVGAVLLLVLAALLGALVYLSWPALHSGPRLLRTAVVGVVVVRALSFLT